jgi:hypothetical protein
VVQTDTQAVHSLDPAVERLLVDARARAKQTELNRIEHDAFEREARRELPGTLDAEVVEDDEAFGMDADYEDDLIGRPVERG